MELLFLLGVTRQIQYGSLYLDEEDNRLFFRNRQREKFNRIITNVILVYPQCGAFTRITAFSVLHHSVTI